MSETRDRGRVGVWLFERVLRAYPKPFRARYGDEMRRTFLERRRAAQESGGGMHLVAFVVREAAGGLVGAVRAHLRRHTDGATKRSSFPDRGANAMDALLQDLRYAGRTLRRNPGFTAVAALVLALGIGANTAIFSVVNAVMLRPLPVTDPDQLVMVWEENPTEGRYKDRVEVANFLAWREQVEGFRDAAAYNGPARAVLTGDGAPEVVTYGRVTGNFFDLLGVRAVLGRTFRAEETWIYPPAVAVLSEAFWSRRFGRDPAAIGSIITINELPVRVVGILPARAEFLGSGRDLWMPHGWDRATLGQEGFARRVRMIARLDDGVSLEQANAQLQGALDLVRRRYPAMNRAMDADITPLHEFLVGDTRTPLLILAGFAALLLLLTCANIANLLLLRASRRGRELSVRTALGAAPGRIARQLLTESLVLALVGGAIGLIAGIAAIRVLLALQPQSAWRLDYVPLDTRVLLFGLGITFVGGLLFGLAPMLRGAAANVAGALKEGTHTTAGSRRATQLLVVAEFALALPLAMGAGLLLRSFVALRQVDLGFRIEDRVAATVALPYSNYHSGSSIRSFVDALVPRLERIPNVEAVTYTSTVPLTGTFGPRELTVEGGARLGRGIEIEHRVVAPNYFRVMGVSLLRGRTFEEIETAEPVMIINRQAMRELFGDADPIGRRVTWDTEPDDESRWYRVVGVVGNEHQYGPHLPPRSEVFVPFRQSASAYFVLILHTRAPASAIARAVRAELLDLDPNVPLFQFQTLEDVYATSLSRERFLLTLIGAFATLALLLATVGVYGVTAEASTQRTQEIGIRLALGAGSGDIARMILRQGLALAAAGIGLGLAAALASTWLLASVLYDITPRDAMTLLVVPLVLGLAAAIACAVPAVRAARSDPVSSLRHE